jgi:hypothetical protein
MVHNNDLRGFWLQLSCYSAALPRQVHLAMSASLIGRLGSSAFDYPPLQCRRSLFAENHEPFFNGIDPERNLLDLDRKI